MGRCSANRAALGIEPGTAPACCIDYFTRRQEIAWVGQNGHAYQAALSTNIAAMRRETHAAFDTSFAREPGTGKISEVSKLPLRIRS